MRYLKPHPIFESENNNSQFPSTREEVEKLCKKYNLRFYTINDDLSVDVEDNVELSRKYLDYIPLNFNYVKYTFFCDLNDLSSFKGCPKEIGGDLRITSNDIDNLDYFPRKIDGNIHIYFNPIYYVVRTFINEKNRNELIEEFQHYRVIETSKTKNNLIRNVYKDRLEMFIGDFDLKMPNIEDIEIYYDII